MKYYIYKIIDKNNNEEFYIGSTNNFSSRKSHHKKNVNNKVGTINQNAGLQFEEGIYNPRDKTITIYEYTDANSLKRVLAHEMGHALGINHVDNPNSIMYYLNNAKTFALTKEDETALVNVCKASFSFLVFSF